MDREKRKLQLETLIPKFNDSKKIDNNYVKMLEYELKVLKLEDQLKEAKFRLAELLQPIHYHKVFYDNTYPIEAIPKSRILDIVKGPIITLTNGKTKERNT